MPHGGCWATNGTCIISSTPHNNIQHWCCYSHSTREGMEALRGEALVPRWRVLSRWEASHVKFPLPHRFLGSILLTSTHFLMEFRTNYFTNNLVVRFLARPCAADPWWWTGWKSYRSPEKGGGEVHKARKHQPSSLGIWQSEDYRPLAMQNAGED